MAAYLEHANITVKNLDNTVRFLTLACPNFKVRGQGRGNDGQRWVHIGTDQAYLAVNEDVRVNEARTMYANSGLNHVGIVVDDAKVVRKKLTENGFREGFVPPKHPHRERIYFFDQDGLEWEFIEYYTDDPAKRNDYAL